MMYPLPADTVRVVLQYISPLSGPLPPHLISTPLRQRHHFLQISPSSPADYLCWPSPDNAESIDLLDRLPPLSDQPSYPTRYTSDPESTVAHVQISSDARGLRMLFHWDDGWRYHDLRLMPFPSPSFSTPQQSHTSNSKGKTMSLRPPSCDRVAAANHINSGDDDSYWDAYGAAGHELISPLPPSGVSKLGVIEGEDAYWAQYASVQGSADSTIPSPLPMNRIHQPVNSNVDESVLSLPPRAHSIIDVPADAIHPPPLTSRARPPSPNTLAHLLSTISPRKETYSPSLYDPYSVQSPYSVDLSTVQTTTDSELITPPLPDGDIDASVVSPVAVQVHGVPFPKHRPPLEEAEDKALTDSIRGLYYLWRAGGNGESGEKDRSGFLRIVQAAIAYD